MKKIIISLLLCMFSSTAYADIGPLAAQCQQKLKECGSVLLQYNDYTTIDFNSTNKKKRTPSAVVTYISNGESIYRETKHVGKYKFYGRNAKLLKNEKIYSLNLNNKEGILYTKSDEKYRGELLNCQYLPVALGFLLPDELKSGNSKANDMVYGFKESTIEIIDGREYQCEIYTGLQPTTSYIKYKLYFLNGVPVMFDEDGNTMEIIKISGLENIRSLDVLRGFTIYAPSDNDMAALLKQKIILESY